MNVYPERGVFASLVHSLRGPRHCLWAMLLAAGCGKSLPPAAAAPAIREVAVVRPARGLFRWVIQQPGSIEAFEDTALLPKISGYVEQWHADIGDRVRKGQVLATLWVPEVAADLRRAEAAIAYDQTLVAQAMEALQAAKAGVNRSEAALRYAEASRLRAEADCERWRLQYARDRRLVSTHAIASMDFEITTNQHKAAQATRDETSAAVEAAKAALAETTAQRNKAIADVRVAEANLQVARANRERAAALLRYARIEAPYDGIVSRRTISRGDFVQPPAGAAQVPLYVVQRRDVMRIFVDVPEADAVWVKEGTPVGVRIPVLHEREFPGTVRRMSYALKRQSRTLLAEVDLSNPDDLLRPGMYAHATIQLERSDVLTLPASAVATQGDVNEGYRHFCFVVENGKVRRMAILVGARGRQQVEVLKKQVEGAWEDFTGEERVVRGDLSSLNDGQDVVVSRDDQ
jgi:HlyD family secretion protein